MKTISISKNGLCEYFVLGFNDGDSDDSQERSNDDYFESETKLDQKQVKKKKRPKDETEQPVYPCDNCIQCFTTQRDLKVVKCCNHLHTVLKLDE